MNFISLDGKLRSADENLLQPDNRAFRYGDGLFETMKMVSGKIGLKHLHFDRLLKSLEILKYQVPDSFTAASLEKEIIELAERNNCAQLCRIRLTVFRGNGNLPDNNKQLNYLIECSPLNASVNNFNPEGLSIGVYPNAQKACDVFSTIKSANFLPYVMGALYARENKLDDCIILNTKGNIADATIANVLLVKNDIIQTPALSEGCINGVMRRWLLEKLLEAGYTCIETSVTEQNLSEADEIFLTNAIHGIRWVKQCGNKTYNNALSQKIYNDLVKTIWP